MRAIHYLKSEQESWNRSSWKSERRKVATTPSYWFANNWRYTRRRVPGEGFETRIIDDRPQQVAIRVTGGGATTLFANESGGHRWQRIPPTERSGRVQSSTVTVAVFAEGEMRHKGFEVRPEDLEIKTCRGSGPGGQKRNKTESAVQVKHIPTGVYVRCDTERSQSVNKEEAIRLLTARLTHESRGKFNSQIASDRKSQVGSGQRGDKIRTVQMQNGVVVNHQTGRKMPAKQYLKGDVEGIA